MLKLQEYILLFMDNGVLYPEELDPYNATLFILDTCDKLYPDDNIRACQLAILKYINNYKQLASDGIKIKEYIDECELRYGSDNVDDALLEIKQYVMKKQNKEK